ncbi:hypothetical protein SAMN05428975_0021 [Mucilaginibacter sp. OK268]|uniref:hypothetical protein n=1 Tax=Mucilaginibacter sp. OK268 TaxID=1881048 RepID=UPI00088C6F13|nr:hypothetical protein [Mucilaginibacter sp. OK268]SDP01548.1 hypothetical protein SAMN05428975_0021 [Mucilaginibacter sp. OK268]
MLNSYIITIPIESGDCEIFVSPFLLQSKEPPNIKSGKIEILYFYGQLRDDAYKARLEQEVLPEKFKSDTYIINYGQDFEKYYLGSLHVDFDTKHYWQWEAKSSKLSEQDVKVLAESLFDPQLPHSKPVTLFTPTRASDINLGLI